MKIYTELMCILPQDPLNEMDDDIEIIKISIQKIELLSKISLPALEETFMGVPRHIKFKNNAIIHNNINV